MRRRSALIVALIVVAAITAGWLSRRTSSGAVEQAAGASPATIVTEADIAVLDQGPAPSVSAATSWINTAPIADGSLVGKVVLYDFWTFGCINCAHTLPHVKAWADRYGPDGLVVVSIHTPEFAYEADPGNVAAYVAENDIRYAVGLDPDSKVWQSWDNHYWPAFYLYDAANRLRLQRAGEGGYGQTEDTIRALLAVDPTSPRAS